ncbi:MAG: VOC family protein [Woeseiaceae bacterium]
MNLNQVTLPARNITESVAFYRKLGLRQIVDSEHYARFECPDGDATFSIHKAEELDLGGVAVVYFEHEELDALCARLKDEGIEFLEMPRDQRWLWREARLDDPSGNRICLYWAGENRKNPPWRISA